MATPVHREPLVEQILALHDRLKAPAGHKAEVIEGSIYISPSPSRHRALISASLNRVTPDHLVVTHNVMLEMTATGERYMPVILVASEGALEFR